MCVLYYNVLHIKYIYVKYIFYMYKYVTCGYTELRRKVINWSKYFKICVVMQLSVNKYRYNTKENKISSTFTIAIVISVTSKQ